MELLVRPDPALGATLHWGAGKKRCAVGKGGIGTKLAEGDGITPVGVYPIRNVLYRSDRLTRPRTGLPVAAIARDDGWCDAPNDPAYNQLVKLPYPADAETMWRDDHLYDVVAVIGFNDGPVMPGKGSAIFLHVASPGYGPTAGCVALALADLLAVLSALKPGDTIRITL